MNKSIDPITDDAELAKVLEGMQDPPVAPPPMTPQQPAAAPGSLSFDEDMTSEPAPYLQPPVAPAYADQSPATSLSPQQPQAPAMAPAAPQPQPAYAPPSMAPVAPQPNPAYAPGIESSIVPPHTLSPIAAGNLDAIKKDALDNLRPLVDKLTLPADEKFDTLLLLIRSTDDQSLVTPAYDAARNISDESKRAQALLDIIKEIDYFSHPNSTQQPTPPPA